MGECPHCGAKGVHTCRGGVEAQFFGGPRDGENIVVDHPWVETVEHAPISELLAEALDPEADLTPSYRVTRWQLERTKTVMRLVAENDG